MKTIKTIEKASLFCLTRKGIDHSPKETIAWRQSYNFVSGKILITQRREGAKSLCRTIQRRCRYHSCGDTEPDATISRRKLEELEQL